VTNGEGMESGVRFFATAHASARRATCNTGKERNKIILIRLYFEWEEIK